MSVFFDLADTMDQDSPKSSPSLDVVERDVRPSAQTEGSDSGTSSSGQSVSAAPSHLSISSPTAPKAVRRWKFLAKNFLGKRASTTSSNEPREKKPRSVEDKTVCDVVREPLQAIRYPSYGFFHVENVDDEMRAEGDHRNWFRFSVPGEKIEFTVSMRLTTAVMKPPRKSQLRIATYVLGLPSRTQIYEGRTYWLQQHRKRWHLVF